MNIYPLPQRVGDLKGVHLFKNELLGISRFRKPIEETLHCVVLEEIIERPSRFAGLVQEPLVYRVRDVPGG